MEFKLDEKQRGKILSLGIVPKGNEEVFFNSLEAHLQESRIWRPGDNKSPTKKNKDHLKKIGKAAKNSNFF
jgi:hypothetical protein